MDEGKLQLAHIKMENSTSYESDGERCTPNLDAQMKEPHVEHESNTTLIKVENFNVTETCTPECKTEVIEAQNLKTDESSGLCLPMNNENGEFFIDPELVEMYQEGLQYNGWNPTQVLNEICISCKWEPPEFLRFNSSEVKGFLFGVRLKGVTFVASESGQNMRLAKHLASTECLKYLGFKFEHNLNNDVKTHTLNLNTSMVSSNITKRKAVKFNRKETEGKGGSRTEEKTQSKYEVHNHLYNDRMKEPYRDSEHEDDERRKKRSRSPSSKPRDSKNFHRARRITEDLNAPQQAFSRFHCCQHMHNDCTSKSYCDKNHEDDDLERKRICHRASPKPWDYKNVSRDHTCKIREDNLNTPKRALPRFHRRDPRQFSIVLREGARILMDFREIPESEIQRNNVPFYQNLSFPIYQINQNVPPKCSTDPTLYLD